ncbi:hypothetical protein HU200_039404 [Digitaria exilis]|uniref:F-box domain-containing protein n=1 Tax=Digitaria exilis TaxID=1010633 RepID=A0A835EJP2_9POAL|nr:hypothetical protein HU200_039404 [Digitaria exilis]
MNEHGDVDKDDDKPVGGGDLHLPCFEKATTISLNINFLGLALPPQGIFARLTELSLRRLRFRSPSELGSVVSSPRCPCLKKLEVSNSRGLQNLSIHSESLLQLKLLDLHRLLHLTIVAPILQELGVGSCIRARGPSEPVAIANISAPQLVALDWKDFYDPQYVHLGDLGQLQRLTTAYDAYGRHTTLSQHRLRLLQRFQAAALYSLHLWLIYLQVSAHPSVVEYCSFDIGWEVASQLKHAYRCLAYLVSMYNDLFVWMCTGLRSLYLFVARSNLELEAESKFFPISMAQTGGEIAAKRPKPSDDGDGAGEDRLSALPDDVLVLILLRLDGVAAAARTSILSRRWRRVWALLPELRFDLVPDVHHIREILDAPEAPELRSISITTEGAGPDSASAWLPVAARRLIGGLVYSNMVPGNDDEEEVEEEGEAGARGEVQLPCFEKATVIVLDLGLLGLALPSAGVFARITKLYLSRVWFRGPCDLGNVVSSPRCPCLQRLKVSESRGMRNLSIHSESLLRIKLENLHLLRQLTIVAPKLLKLCMDFNFIDDDPSEPVANISAPQLVSLVWRDAYDSRYVHLGNLGRLRRLTSIFIVYGDQDNRDHNHQSMSLLQKFQILHSLNLTLIYRKVSTQPNPTQSNHFACDTQLFKIRYFLFPA